MDDVNNLFHAEKKDVHVLCNCDLCKVKYSIRTNFIAKIIRIIADNLKYSKLISYYNLALKAPLFKLPENIVLNVFFFSKSPRDVKSTKKNTVNIYFLCCTKIANVSCTHVIYARREQLHSESCFRVQGMGGGNNDQ